MSEDNQSRTDPGNAGAGASPDRSWRRVRERLLGGLPAGLTRPARAILGPLEVLAWADNEEAALQWLSDPAHECELVLIDLFLRSGSGMGLLSALAGVAWYFQFFFYNSIN